MSLPRSSAAPLVLAALASATLALHFIDPAEARWLPFCLFHALTGLHCAGCGTTRALHLLAHGDVLGALHMNVLAVSAIPSLAYASARRIDLGRQPRTIAAVLALAVAFAAARNIPAYPFELLAPSPIATSSTRTLTRALDRAFASPGYRTHEEHRRRADEMLNDPNARTPARVEFWVVIPFEEFTTPALTTDRIKQFADCHGYTALSRTEAEFFDSLQLAPESFGEDFEARARIEGLSRLPFSVSRRGGVLWSRQGWLRATISSKSGACFTNGRGTRGAGSAESQIQDAPEGRL